MSDDTQFSAEHDIRFGTAHAVEVDGKRIVYATPNDATLWRVKTLFTKEPVTIEWLKAMPAGSRFLDIGANVGMYSIFAAKMRACRVFAFEPESQNYALLNRNIFLNDVSGLVSAFCAALSDREGLETLYLSDFVAGGSCHSVGQSVDFNLQPRTTSYAQACIAMTVDRLIESGAMPVPEFIKIDVDGFEHRVIDGAETTLRDPGVRSVIIELNPKLPEHLGVIEKLRGMGFEFDKEQVRRSTRQSGLFEGVAEHVFSRSASGLAPGATAPLRRSTTRIEDAVCSSIEAAPVNAVPFEHCIIDGIFPPDFLAEIYRHWPADHELMPIEDSGRVTVSPEQQGRRKVVFLTEQGLSRLAPERRAFWRESMWPWLSGPRFRQALLDKFRDIIEPRLTPGTTIVADALIVSDRTDYAIGPHTDSPRRLVSLLFYLPEDATLSGFGTSLYKPRVEGFTSEGGPHLAVDDFTRVRTVEFLPNRLIMFPKTNRCFHGVEPLARPGIDRRLLIFDLQLVSAKPAKGGSPLAPPVEAVSQQSATGGRYSRSNPSARYRELIQLYERMHREGERFLNIPPGDTFPGSSLLPHLRVVKALIDSTGALDLLDYGAGKGTQYRPQRVTIEGLEGEWDSVAEYWEVDNVSCYDPCHTPFSTLPQGTFDGVISTDVLEHCPEEDVPWVLEEIFSFAHKFVFLTVAGYVARKRLPNGENAHSTIKPLDWWRDLIVAVAARHPGIAWRARYYGQNGPGTFEEFGDPAK